MVTSDEIKRKLEEKRRTKSPAKVESLEDSRSRELVEEEADTLMYCPNCDEDYEGDANFCPECGTRLEEYQPSPVEEAPATPSEVPEATPGLISGDIIIVSSNYVPGYKAIKNLGFVYGLTVRSRGLGGQIGAGLRSLVGGEIKEYVHLMEQSREEALTRMKEHAREKGANAIISTRFDSDQISDIMQEILAYGTAVIIEKEDK